MLDILVKSYFFLDLSGVIGATAGGTPIKAITNRKGRSLSIMIALTSVEN